MAANIKERTYEYSISFDSENLVKVDGGYCVFGGTIRLARKRQHRHENPSKMKWRFRKRPYLSLKEYFAQRAYL